MTKKQNTTTTPAASEQGTDTASPLDTILANVTGYDESAARVAMGTAMVELEQVESGAIIGTVKARAAIGAVCERFYSLTHGKPAPSLSAAAKDVPEDVREGRSESFFKLCIRTHRLHTPERYRMWSDACGTDAEKSDPPAFKRNADAYLRWLDAANDKRVSESGAVLAPSAKSNRSGTGEKPAPLAGESVADYRKRIADAQAEKERAALAQAVERVSARDTFGNLKRATVEKLSTDNLADLVTYAQHLLAQRHAAEKVAAAAAAEAEKEREQVAAQVSEMSAADMAEFLAWKAAQSATA